jgi:hypothetical protein
MEISIEELNALSDKTGAMQVRIAELERALREQQAENARQRDEIERMKAELVDVQNVTTARYMENIFLKNLLILSGERIKVFMQHLKNIDKWALLRTFVDCCLPDRHRAEQKQLMDELMALPSENTKPQILMQNPTFEGPMYDVHDNDDVKLSD